MKRKSKELEIELNAQAKELAEQKERLEATEKLRQEAIKEEQEFLAELTSNINKIGDDNGLFIGIVLSKEDIVSIIDLALRTNESVKIPFNLYLKETT
jgi:hypothetical protein